MRKLLVASCLAVILMSGCKKPPARFGGCFIFTQPWDLTDEEYQAISEALGETAHGHVFNFPTCDP